jgi:hypothetical protein
MPPLCSDHCSAALHSLLFSSHRPALPASMVSPMFLLEVKGASHQACRSIAAAELQHRCHPICSAARLPDNAWPQALSATQACYPLWVVWGVGAEGEAAWRLICWAPSGASALWPLAPNPGPDQLHAVACSQLATTAICVRGASGRWVKQQWTSCPLTWRAAAAARVDASRWGPLAGMGHADGGEQPMPCVAGKQWQAVPGHATWRCPPWSCAPSNKQVLHSSAC